MYVNTVRNTLCAPVLDLQIQIVRKRGHVYLEWTKKDTILFTKNELVKLHRNFSHPSSDKLYN